MEFGKVSLVYFSTTNVTKKYVEAMGRAAGKPTKTYDFTLPAKRIPEKAPSFTSEDLVIIGIPVYGGRVPTICLEYLEALKGENTPVVLVATYGNRAYEDALVELEDLMTDRGFVVVGGAAVVGRHSFSDEIAGNRPDENDLEGAKEFIKLVIDKDGLPMPKGVIPGNRPYKEKGGANTLMPVTSDACINCKACAMRCPNGVISMENPKERVKDASACLRCHRCVVFCPKHAISFEGENYEKMVAGCIARFGKPDRENEYFM